MLIESFENYVSETFDVNRITLSYNPMMTIALTAEILQRIGRLRRRYLDACTGMVEELLKLGSYFNGKIDDEEYFR
jgi:hypothetical protein